MTEHHTITNAIEDGYNQIWQVSEHTFIDDEAGEDAVSTTSSFESFAHLEPLGVTDWVPAGCADYEADYDGDVVVLVTWFTVDTIMDRGDCYPVAIQHIAQRVHPTT